jgi:hypothetical protein
MPNPQPAIAPAGILPIIVDAKATHSSHPARAGCPICLLAPILPDKRFHSASIRSQHAAFLMDTPKAGVVPLKQKIGSP